MKASCVGVFGGLRVPEQAQAEVVDGRLVVFDEHIEGGEVALTGAREQFGFVWPWFHLRSFYRRGGRSPAERPVTNPLPVRLRLMSVRFV